MLQGPFTTRTVRAIGKSAWAGLLRSVGILPLAKRWVRRQGTVVLTFHRVLNDAELEGTASLIGMIVRNCTFDDFLAYAARNLEIVSAGSDPEWKSNGKLKIALTFDDGWCDNATEAFPIARKHNAPITIFIVAKKIGTKLPFWPEQAASVLGLGLDAGTQQRQRSIEQVIEYMKSLPSVERKRIINRITQGDDGADSSKEVDRTMTWEQIEELKAGGVVFGSHTSTHEILTRIPLSQAMEEVQASRELITQRLGSTCDVFAYPNGDSSHETRSLVEKAGYKRAFLNQCPGIWSSATDPFAIPRVNICEYHLVDKEGNFSPLIFDYAVVWATAKCHFQCKLASTFQKLKYRLSALTSPGRARLTESKGKAALSEPGQQRR
jgi:peptidoglycan/xylan/chitin deacetylase (PgdA/CDA1 family)